MAFIYRFTNTKLVQEIYDLFTQLTVWNMILKMFDSKEWRWVFFVTFRQLWDPCSNNPSDHGNVDGSHSSGASFEARIFQMWGSYFVPELITNFFIKWWNVWSEGLTGLMYLYWCVFGE